MSQDVWSDISRTLDDDERMIWPDMYEENRLLYDKICDAVYLIRVTKNLNSTIDWVREHNINKVLSDRDNKVEVLARLLIVRLRLPWNRLEREWTISKEELYSHREDFDVIDVMLKVRKKEYPEKVLLVDPIDFEMNRDKYVILEARYLVSWRGDRRKQVEKYLGIDPETFSLKPQM